MTPQSKKKVKKTARGRHHSDAMLFMLAGMVMRTCETCVEPDEAIPAAVGWLNTATTLQQGGICALYFMKCQEPLFDLTDQAEWQAQIDAGNIIVMADCAIEADLGTEANTVTRGCGAEERVTSRTMTLNVSDVSDNKSWSHAYWWQHTQKFPKSYRVAYATYDGTIYPFNECVINANLAIENTIDGFKNHTASIQWKKLTNDVPLILTWSPNALTIPSCTANINVLSFVGGNLTLQVVPRLSQGAVSATYAWTVNALPDPSTTTTITVTGATSGDAIVATVTDNLGCVSTATYTVP